MTVDELSKEYRRVCRALHAAERRAMCCVRQKTRKCRPLAAGMKPERDTLRAGAR